ncbi:MAG TPA: hypothetical protein VIJ46_06915 [Rhabdochlamydiaceae bacterium]
MKKWICLFSLLTTACFARNAETVAIVEKAKADAPVYAHLAARLVDKYTKMSEVADCSIEIYENALTAKVEGVNVAMRIDPEKLKKHRQLYQSKAEAAISVLSTKAKRKVRGVIAKEMDIEKIVPAYTQMLQQSLMRAFPDLDPDNIEIVVTTK